MVDQNSNSPVQNTHKPQASGEATQKDVLSQPTVVKAGEAMLIISLVLIFLVACTVSLHLFLKRRKQRLSTKHSCPIRRNKEMKNKGKRRTRNKEGLEQPELQSQEKTIAELPGTPLCEMGDSEPRHEMEDAEVAEQHVQAEIDGHSYSDASGHLESDRWSVINSESASPMDLEAGILWYDASEEKVEVDSRQLAMYWSRGI